MATKNAETLLAEIRARLETQISGLHVSQQIDVVTADPRALAHLGSAILRVGDTVNDEVHTRLAGKVRVIDAIEVQTAVKVDPRDQLTTRDALLTRGRAIREALTGSWGDVAGRRATYLGSDGPARHPASAEWAVLTQRFEFHRFATLGA